MQEKVPRHALSRVAAYDWMGSSALRPLGLALVGPIASVIGIDTTLLAAAVIVLLTNLGMLAVRSIRELRSGQVSPAEA
jgi:hypothetical protein